MNMKVGGIMVLNEYKKKVALSFLMNMKVGGIIILNEYESRWHYRS